MFPKINPTATKSWSDLKKHFQSDKHLLEKKDEAFFKKSLGENIKIDYQYGLWNKETINLLIELAEECKLSKAIESLFSGKKINETEGRAVLHTALRDFSSNSVYVDGKDVKPNIEAEREKIRTFVDKLHAGEIRG